MNPVLEQIRFMRRIVGLGRILGMRKKHALGLRYVRGYAATNCLWALMNVGLLDELTLQESVDIKEFARRKGLNEHVLESVCEYLDGIKVLEFDGGRCSLDTKGATLMKEPRGLFDLLYGYEPVFRELENLMRSNKTYGVDVFRRGEAVAKGSGELGRQLPFLAVRELVLSNGFRRVLDLGCGDLEFLFLLCENTDVTCFGIDNDREALEYARTRLKQSGFEERIRVAPADMFDVRGIAEQFPDPDAITAIDVFHEYFHGGSNTITDLMRQFKEHFPATRLIVAEFFKLSRVWLRRVPTTTLEHHLFHSLTNQTILPLKELIEVFERAGYTVVEKKLLHSIGHAYFVLK